MSEKKPMPKCPYCGAKMKIEKPLFVTQYEEIPLGTNAGWCTQATCDECGAASPFISGMETEKDAYEVAREKAMRRWQEPNRVLTLEEVMADAYAEDWSFELIEKKNHIYQCYHIYQCCPLDVTAESIIFVAAGIGIKDGIYMKKSEYGVTWRCWLREPTREEMDETPWEGEKDA